MTRDNILEGDTGASAVARAIGQADDPPPEMQIRVPANVAANIEGLVARVGDDVPGGEGHLWKLTRVFDDPATWTEPHVRHLADDDPAGATFRTTPLPDEFELYDLDADPIEATNRADTEPDVFAHLLARLDAERTRAVPPRHSSWTYATWARSA